MTTQTDFIHVKDTGSLIKIDWAWRDQPTEHGFTLVALAGLLGSLLALGILMSHAQGGTNQFLFWVFVVAMVCLLGGILYLFLVYRLNHTVIELTPDRMDIYHFPFYRRRGNHHDNLVFEQFLCQKWDVVHKNNVTILGDYRLVGIPLGRVPEVIFKIPVHSAETGQFIANTLNEFVLRDVAAPIIG